MPKILCCGSRKWNKPEMVQEVLSKFPEDTIVMHCMAEGADQIAAQIAAKLGFVVQQCSGVDENDCSDTPNRAIQMMENKPDLVIAFHDDIGESIGTKHILQEAKRRDIAVKMITG